MKASQNSRSTRKRTVKPDGPGVDFGKYASQAPIEDQLHAFNRSGYAYTTVLTGWLSEMRCSGCGSDTPVCFKPNTDGEPLLCWCLVCATTS